MLAQKRFKHNFGFFACEILEDSRTIRHVSNLRFIAGSAIKLIDWKKSNFAVYGRMLLKDAKRNFEVS